MFFFAVSPRAQASLEQFLVYLNSSPQGKNHLFREKLDSCGHKLFLIAGDKIHFGEVQPKEIDPQTLQDLSTAWRRILESQGKHDVSVENDWQIIDHICECATIRLPSTSLYVRRYRYSQAEDIYIILLTGDEPVGLPSHEILPLCNLWQFKQGAFPLHAAGVVHQERLYLFTGPSGAGKSTAAALSRAGGDWVIDDDQVLIQPREGGGYRADGWGYGVVPCAASLQAIIWLIQDTQDQLIPLKQRHVARLILERHGEILGRSLAGDMVRDAFHRSCDIARQVPGFELHFRKSPDFWKLIDAQFPD